MAKSESNNAIPRPPVVVVMGHVDHGKTTLLDHIRKANVAEREAGGITQAVGAYEITHAGKKITFIDTPGHEAFISMRSRGATIADLAILVVAGDEGVKPQTKEVIGIIQKSETPFVVAITKIDKPAANVEKVKQELAEAGVLLEGYGGQVSWHGVSAKTGEGISDLLDLVLLAAEVEGLTYDPKATASGFILEVRKDSRRGLEASVIIKNGMLTRGDSIATVSASGKVKILEDFTGKTVSSLEPSAPARIIGFENIPAVGEAFSVGEGSIQPKNIPARRGGTLPKVVKEDEIPTLRLALKASDAGSLEALSIIIKNIKVKDVQVTVLAESVGDITDGDVQDAITNGAAIIGFKTRVEKSARNMAEVHRVRIVTSEIVYDLLKTVEEFMQGIGKPAIIGMLEVLAIFNQDKLAKQLVGGRVVEGTFKNKGVCEIARLENNGEKIVGSAKILNLRDKKTEAIQAEKGKEAGVLLDTSIEIKKGDKLVIREKR